MHDTKTQQAHFLISVGATSTEEIDTSTMRAGIEQGIDIARNEGMLTPLADETTDIGAIKVSDPSSPAAALVLILGSSIADTPEARSAVERLVQSLVRQYPRERITVLTEDERDTLLAGITETRRSWEASDGDWISDIVNNGYEGYAAGPDIDLLEAAFCENPVFAHLTDDAMRLGVLRILANPQVIELISSSDRAQPINDFEEFGRQVGHAVWPMTAAGRKSRPEDVLEALQLQGRINQLLEERMGKYAVGEDEDEDEDKLGEVVAGPRG